MRKFINILVLVVALVGTVSAQSLDDLSKKVLDLSFGVINQGINAYEEQLEKQELEETKKIEEEAKKLEEAAKKAEEEELEAEEADTENNKLLKFQWFQEVEVDKDSDEEIELRNALAYTVFSNLLRDEDKAFKIYCVGIADYVWYRFAKKDDGEFHVDLYIDDNGDVGHELCSGILKDWRYIKVKNTITGTVSTAILVYIDDSNFKMLFIQDSNNPSNFFIFF